MIYQADWLLTLTGPPIRNGWVRVEGDHIAAVGWPGDLPPGELRKLEHCVLLPGLINAHCHVELTSMKNRLTPGNSFPFWVDELRNLTSSFSPADFKRSAKEGVSLLLQGGATTVVDVGNTGDALPVLAASPLRSFAFVETLGLDPDLAQSRFARAHDTAESVPNSGKFNPGIAPHAAYSCSPALFAQVNRYQGKRNLPVTFHASESREETDLFATASGPLQDFCRRIFPQSPEHHSTTPLQWLDENRLLPDGALIVHGNHLDEKDRVLLVIHKAAIVHCPSSHRFFGHQPFPYADLERQGIPVCLGTDSRASGESLSMLDQMRLFRKNFPSATAEKTLRMATVVAAHALEMGKELGTLQPGSKADFIAVQIHASENPYGAILERDASVFLSVIDGVETLPTA